MHYDFLCAVDVAAVGTVKSNYDEEVLTFDEMGLREELLRGIYGTTLPTHPVAAVVCRKIRRDSWVPTRVFACAAVRGALGSCVLKVCLFCRARNFPMGTAVRCVGYVALIFLVLSSVTWRGVAWQRTALRSRLRSRSAPSCPSCAAVTRSRRRSLARARPARSPSASCRRLRSRTRAARRWCWRPRASSRSRYRVLLTLRSDVLSLSLSLCSVVHTLSLLRCALALSGFSLLSLGAELSARTVSSCH